MMNRPVFEHRHFVEMAGIISRLPDRHPTEELPMREWVAIHFMGSLANSNPKFDANRFYDACMGNPQTGRDR
jgi:hypothetical protein